MSVLTFVLEDALKRLHLNDMTVTFVIHPETGRNTTPIRVYAPNGLAVCIVRAYMADGRQVSLRGPIAIPVGQSAVFEPGTLQLAAPKPTIGDAELAVLAKDLHSAAVDARLGTAEMWRLITAALGREITGERTKMFNGFSLGQAADILASDYYRRTQQTPEARFQAAAKTVLEWLGRS